MGTIRALPTVYAGVRFRSRLEARWALFFDKLGIRWEYEPEGFQLPSGACYLPDFWLPTFNGGMYAEVKPTGGDFSKAREFVAASAKSLWCCDGPPDTRSYIILSDGGTEPVVDWEGIPNFDQAEDDNRMYWQPEFCEGPMRQIPIDMLRDFGGAPHAIVSAVSAARTERFGT